MLEAQVAPRAPQAAGSLSSRSRVEAPWRWRSLCAPRCAPRCVPRCVPRRGSALARSVGGRGVGHLPWTIAAALFFIAAPGCVTPRIDPALYEARTFAIASVYARKTIWFENVGVSPTFYENDLGTEVLEMELGETEGRLSELFGVDMVPAGKVVPLPAYRELPELQPADEWTRINDMTAVDLAAPEAVLSLATLARALGVDAVIVLRHEWTLARDRFEVTDGVTAFDRCSILVVDGDGRKLWEDTVVARAPAQIFSAGSWGVGLQGATWADEARQLARRTGREALRLLERRYREAEGKARSSAAPAQARRMQSSPPVSSETPAGRSS
jgi:hypothetical protein